MTNIVLEENGFDGVRAAIARSAMVVTDSNVAALYGTLCDGAFVIDAGEKSKSPETLFSVIDGMYERGLCRNDTVVALGGGVTGDITGLAASLYMRGIRWISVPTTLVAMVDSGLGGKTAVDRRGVKNLVGTFHAPTDMVVSLEFIKTLPDREYIGGCGELIKTCLLTRNSYRLLRERFDALCARDASCLTEPVRACIAIKNTVVTDDFRESGVRKILNVGHTVGHALESVNGYKAGHGEYVLMGMMTECAMFKDMIDDDFYSAIIGMCRRFASPPKTSVKPVCELASKDKKNVDGQITVMLPVAAGDVLEVRVDRAEFSARYERAVAELKNER